MTTRTAGFNTIDVGNIKTPTALLLMALMFIGGAPLSAAGGIKVTTFVIATIAILIRYAKKKTTLYLIEKYQKDTYSCLS